MDVAACFTGPRAHSRSLAPALATFPRPQGMKAYENSANLAGDLGFSVSHKSHQKSPGFIWPAMYPKTFVKRYITLIGTGTRAHILNKSQPLFLGHQASGTGRGTDG